MSMFGFLQNRATNNIAVALIVGFGFVNFVQGVGYLVLPQWLRANGSPIYSWRDIAIQAIMLVASLLVAWLLSLLARGQ